MPRVKLFATNLLNPTHMEWTNDGRLLVSEISAGRVKDVTNGGDMLSSEPFAFGLQGPAGLLPLPDGRCLISESWSGIVRDISKGGNAAQGAVFASGLTAPYGLCRVVRDDGDHIYISESHKSRETWLTDITAGGATHNVYVEESPTRPGLAGVTPIDSWPDHWQDFAVVSCVKKWADSGVNNRSLYMSVGALGQVLDVTQSGGNFMELLKQGRTIAWGLDQIGGIKTHQQSGLIYGVEPKTGSVFAVDPSSPRNYQFDPPIVRGLHGPTCVRFSADGKIMFVCGQADGVIWEVTDFN